MIEITEQEFIDNIDSDDFCARFGNPVQIRTASGCFVCISFALYGRLFGEQELNEDNSIELCELLEKGMGVIEKRLSSSYGR